jgi:ubiquitin-protein ligase
MASTKRISKDLISIQQDPIEGISLALKTDGNLFQWCGTVEPGGPLYGKTKLKYKQF